MDTSRIDTISKYVAERQLSRRQVLGGATRPTVSGLVAATPAAPPAAATQSYPKMLYVQSFQSGSIKAKTGAAGHYTVTLEHGLGQTTYFSDRPERIVGTGATEQFLKSFRFGKHNPPNAALVVETAAGATEITVVELADPVYDPTGPTVTYDIKPLANWEETLKFRFNQASTDLTKLTPVFETANLFIDDCANETITCTANDADYPCPGQGGICGQWENQGYCYNWSQPGCWPCEPYDHLNPTAERVYEYWENKCNNTFPSCKEGERASGGCYANI